MTVFAANLNFKDFNDKTVAKVIFNYFLAQYEDAIKEHCSERATLNAWRMANKCYEQENDIVGGFLTGHPFKEESIKHKEMQVNTAEQNVKEAKRIIEFLRDRFLAGVLET